MFDEMNKYFNGDPYRYFIFLRTYSRFNEEQGRRELWSEAIDRYVAFMRENLGDKLSEEEYQEVREYILYQKVMPSMRLLWSSGQACRKTNATAYNCSFIAPSQLQDFGEMLYLLTCGCGVGFSVERHVVDKLPKIAEQTGEKLPTHAVDDSREGWAEALVLGLNTWFSGRDIEFNFDKVRPSGARLKTMGGRASGPEPLDGLLKFSRGKIIARQGQKLRPIDVHDIICKIGDIVVMGGVRRSSEISLSDLDDPEMKVAKFGAFYLTEPQRSMANNSVAYKIKPTQQEFMEEWLSLMKSGSGERGIFNRAGLAIQMPRRRWEASQEYIDTMGTNPCISGDTLIAVADGRNSVSIKQLIKEGKDVPVYSRNTADGQIQIKMGRNPRKTGLQKEVWEVELDDNTKITATPDHKFLLKNLTYAELKDLKSGDSLSPFNSFNSNRYRQIAEVGAKMSGGHRRNRRQYRLIYEFFKGTVNPKTTAVHHGDINSYNDSIDNLLAISHEEHRNIHTKNMMGLKNPYHRMSKQWKFNFASHRGGANGRFSGHSNQELIEWGKKIFKEKGILTHNLWIEHAKKHALPQFVGNKFRFGSWSNFKNQVSTNHKVKSVKFKGYEDVYNITVDDNHNYGVLTSGKDRFIVSSGVFVKNCGEITLRSKEFCNLTEVVSRFDDDFNSLKDKVRIATIIGTYQSSLTNLPYLSKQWSENCNEERLLGVSITGQFDCPAIRDADTLRRLRDYSVEVNKSYAQRFGINPSASITCVKPSGCATLGTKIKTNRGIMSFRELSNNLGIRFDDTGWFEAKTDVEVYDEKNNLQKIEKFYINGIADVYDIEDVSGNTYSFTGNHKLLLTSGEWKEVRKITEKDEIMTLK